MVFELVNTGTAADSGDGDNIREAYEKINASLQYLADQLLVGIDSSGDVVLDRVTGRNYGTPVAPISSAIVIDDTDAVVNGSAIVFHNAATSPEIETELATVIVGSYVANTLNVVSFLFTTGGLLISYTQPTFNPGGSGTNAPANAVAPAILFDPAAGIAYPGYDLDNNNGSWANFPDSFTYQWFRDGVAIAGETNKTLPLGVTDIGKDFRVDVVATNATGSSPAVSSNSVTCWHPNDVADVASVHLADLGTPTVDGDPIVNWGDQFGGNPANPTPGFGTPTVSRPAGEYPSVVFDDDNSDFLTQLNAVGVMRDVGFGYIFIAFESTEPDSGTNSHPVIVYNTNGNGVRAAIFTRAGGTSVIRVFARTLDTDASAFAESPFVAGENVIAGEFLFSQGSVNVRVDGAQIDSAGLASSGNSSDTDSAVVRMGSTVSANNFVSMNVKGAVVVAGDAAISATDRSRIERYLGLICSPAKDIPLV